MPTRRHFLQQASFGLASLALWRQQAAAAARTYTNPVYAGQFPDPFVLRHKNLYYAFGTTGKGRTSDGRIFTVLTSPNLVDWKPAGGALLPPPEADGADFWAPEVVEHKGTFYMYYSRGGGAIAATVGHRLHVATSRNPAGPYHEVAQIKVPGSQFTIDAHPFRDVDGQWYLFYARDFTDTDTANGYRPGTGLVADKLVGMTRLAGQERTIMRARHDWTVFEKNRLMPLYGNQTFPEWHTLEGPFVRRHEGRYYCFYSGANFLTDRYGVDVCVADSVLGPYTDAGAENGARVLHSVPGKVRGPGHHSHIMGPDGRTEYLVYHAWNEAMTERQLCIDPLLWTPEGPRCQGPTFTPQPLPS
ncbi:glycoside hydrolase family 43 protein [Hymenobacter weizhouensis]|uniref:glycoside hydrolase family 43 protein n=1 Tax=Hymenobacter sp. YIM 151500-1 TaxID=2987689 RepID=UPI002227E2C4|nr:glycoside hydrolase family 43 protein [Hymenobacter sp. YIM 151500-1]UYZ62099.1 glycoside hydrolase family 43 protein [Hymenobacter sp. YIM 151500-1]